MYEAADVLLLRSPALPASVANVDWAEPNDARDLLAHHPHVISAIRLASESLSAEVERTVRLSEVLSGRATRALARYLDRMCTRSTPFGLFAGVTVVTWADKTSVKRTGKDRVVVRPDLEVVMRLLRTAHETDDAQYPSGVYANPLVRLVGDRLDLPSSDIYGESDDRAISFAATDLLGHVLTAARSPRSMDELVESLSTRTTWDANKLRRFLRLLISKHVLVGADRPQLSGSAWEQTLRQDHEGHLPSEPYGASRRALQNYLTSASTHQLSLDQYVSTTAMSPSAMTEHEQDIRLGSHVDLLLGVDGTVARSVSQRLSEALSVGLATVSPERRFTHLHEYHRLMLERYGPLSRVPLLELLDPHTGLGAPRSYTQPASDETTCSVIPHSPLRTERERLLINWAAEALLGNERQLELTDERVAELIAVDHPDEQYRRPLEGYLELYAQDVDAINRGEWTGVIGAAGFIPAGLTASRFVDQLSEEEGASFRDLLKSDEKEHQDAVFAEVLFWPPRSHHANIGRRPELRTHQIPVNVPPSVGHDFVVHLNEVEVHADAKGMHLTWARTGQTLYATHSTLLNPTMGPNACRFILEVTRSKWLDHVDFNWPFATSQSFFPRVTRRNIVLRRAQWSIRGRALDELRRQDSGQVSSWLAEWQNALGLPATVALVDFDQRHRIDFLTDRGQYELRRAARDCAGVLRLDEILPVEDQAWLEDGLGRRYHAELVAPLVPTGATSQPTALLATKRRLVRAAGNVLSYGPGSQWFSANLYCSRLAAPMVITHLRRIATTLGSKGLCDRWFFVRYQDENGHHVRFRAHAPSIAENVDLLVTGTSSLNELRERAAVRDFTLNNYIPEIERYGGLKATSLLEMIFCHDSEYAADLLAARGDPNTSTEVAAPSLVHGLDSFMARWGFSATEREKLSIPTVPKKAVASELREFRASLMEAVAHDEPRSAHGLGDCFPETLADAGALESLRRLDSAGLLQNSIASIAASAIHMHCNRIFGVNSDREHKLIALWHQALASSRLRKVHRS